MDGRDPLDVSPANHGVSQPKGEENESVAGGLERSKGSGAGKTTKNKEVG